MKNLAESGVMDRIVKKYQPTPKQACQAQTEALGPQNTFLPFSLLACGALTALMALVVESLTARARLSKGVVMARDKSDLDLLQRCQAVCSSMTLSDEVKVQCLRRLLSTQSGNSLT